MRLLTYNEFFRAKVQRKKNELKNPRYHVLGELQLPRNSLLHFIPSTINEIGPSQTEAMVNNYPKEVYINFINDFEPVIGKGKRVAVETRVLIKNYRSKHFNYNWTRDINTVYRKEIVMVVNSYGLVDKVWVPRPTMFATFDNFYDKFNMLVENINKEAERGSRNQFFRIELPNTLPGFLDLMVDYDNWIKSFEENEEGRLVPVPTQRTVRLTKRENSYWLLDWMAFVFGDYKYSQFNNISEKARKNLHIIFTKHGKSLVIRLDIIKEWLDELNEDSVTADEDKSVRFKLTRRLNASKRIYLNLLTLVRESTPEVELEEEKENAKERETVVDGKPTKTEGGGSGKDLREEEEESLPSEDETEDDSDDPVTLADILSVDQGPEPESFGRETPKGDEDDHQEDEPESDEDVQQDEEDIDDDWAGEVDDSLLEQEDIEVETSLDKDPFETPVSGVVLALEEKAREGTMSVAEYKFFEKKANRFKELKMSTGETLEEFIDIKEEELSDLEEDAKIEGDFPTVLDESMLRSRSTTLKKNYVKKFLKRDVVKTIIGVQNAGIAVNDFKHEEISGVEGDYDVFSVQLHPVDGEQSTHTIRLPKVQEDGTFVVDGVRSHLQSQRMEAPIRKIDKDRVLLTSYYPNTVMLTRSRKVADSLSSFLVKQVVALSKEKKNGVSFKRGNTFDNSLKAPRVHSVFSFTFKEIKTKQVTLNFDHNELVKKHPEFKKHNKINDFLIGVTPSNKPITIDSSGMLFVDGKEAQDIYSTIGIEQAKMPLENVVVNISGYLYPLGVILCYYFGLEELLKLTKVNTRTVPMGTRPNLGPDEFSFNFNDEYLIFNKNERLATLIFGGMAKLKNMSNFSRSDLSDKGIWVPLMGDPRVKPQHFLEMKNLYDLFIDPITKGELKKMGYSQSFHFLLLDAVKMLETDHASHEVEIKEQRIVGYERFSGHVYREMVKSIKAYRVKGKNRKFKIDLNPEAVITNIITDTSANLVEEVNPVHEIKDQEELTFGGTGGRSEISVVKRGRYLTDSDIGILSEGGKDSSKTGFVSYLSSDPMIKDYRGNIATDETPTIAGMSSVTGNLNFGIGKDD